MAKMNVNSKGGKVLLAIVAVLVFVAVLLSMPFSSKAREWIAEKIDKPVEFVSMIIKQVVITGVAVFVGFFALALVPVLPVVAVVMAVVAVAAVVYAFWPLLFEGDTMPENTTIEDEVDNQNDDD